MTLNLMVSLLYKGFGKCCVPLHCLAQSAEAVDYTDCFSAEGLRHPPPMNFGYDTKPSDGEVSVLLELWGMRSTPSLTLPSGLLLAKVVAPDRVLSMDQIELNCVLMLNWIVWNGTVFYIETVLMLNWIVWNRTVYIYIYIYIYINGFGLHNLQWLMCHKTKPNPSLPLLPGSLWPGVVVPLRVK